MGNGTCLWMQKKDKTLKRLKIEPVCGGKKKIKHKRDQKWNLSVDENDRAKQSPSTTLPIHMEHP